MRISRRQFVGGAACCGCMGSSLSALAQTEVVLSAEGCFLNGGRADDGYEQVISRGIARQTFYDTTGDKAFDRQLGRAIIKLAGFFEEQPAFGIVDGREHDNAFAMPRTGGASQLGTVGVGRTLLNRLKEEDETGMAILALIAHEFGHVSQFRRDAIKVLNAGETTVRKSELHADYLTGCYLGWLKRNEPRLRVISAGRFMESIGDHAVNSKDHHGTPAERLTATEAGFELAYQEARSFESYFDAGQSFVLKTF